MLPGISTQCRSVLFAIKCQVLTDSVVNRINQSYKLKVLINNFKYMKFHSLRKSEGIRQCKKLTWERSFSTEMNSQVAENKSLTKTNKRKLSFIVPPLTLERVNEITSITGISLGGSYISWIKISVPALKVLEWNVKILPDDFRCQKDEPNILKLAYDVKQSLPVADLYVMETFSMRGRELFEKVNFLHLSSMLTVLLNGLETDPNWKEKVVFQKQFVLNNLHELLLGGERISTRNIVENILYKSLKLDGEPGPTEKFNIYSFAEIHSKYFDLYKESNFQKKEDLSLVFLLTLSFIDVNILRNEKSLEKVLEKKVHRLKKTEVK